MGGATNPTVSFTPLLVPMSRGGILATCTAPLKDPTTTAAQARAAYAEAFADETYLNLLPEGVWPQTKAVQASNRVDVQVTVDPAVNRLIAVAAIDNLTKGTAGGGAIQSMNIALGMAEQTGLPLYGVAP